MPQLMPFLTQVLAVIALLAAMGVPQSQAREIDNELSSTWTAPDEAQRAPATVAKKPAASARKPKAAPDAEEPTTGSPAEKMCRLQPPHVL